MYARARAYTRTRLYSDIAPLSPHRSLWRHIEIQYDREVLFIDFHGVVSGLTYVVCVCVLCVCVRERERERDL